MKTEFTKAERHEIYKRAKVEYLNLLERYYFSGMCYAIDKAMAFIYESFHVVDPRPMLTEFTDQKPEDNKFDPFWWHKFDTESRIKAFDAMIAATAPRNRITSTIPGISDAFAENECEGLFQAGVSIEFWNLKNMHAGYGHRRIYLTVKINDEKYNLVSVTNDTENCDNFMDDDPEVMREARGILFRKALNIDRINEIIYEM